jgi:hypothetical protein
MAGFGAPVEEFATPVRCGSIGNVIHPCLGFCLQRQESVWQLTNIYYPTARLDRYHTGLEDVVAL